MNFVLSDATSPYTRVVGAGGDHKPNGRNALNPQIHSPVLNQLTCTDQINSLLSPHWD